ncbi:MAG: response regulator [Actinobacteria bacterium]|nr:response regulator [Actinomycetota bacterium]
MKLAILVVEDEPPVRTALARDLAPFAGGARIELAEDVEDAWAVVGEVADGGDTLALILSDHRLPGTSGVDFLVSTMTDPRTRAARRVLVTGQAGHEDTIRAINEAELDHYVAKPWDPEEFRAVVREQLTDFVLTSGLDPLPHLAVIDAARAMHALRERPDGRFA